MVFVKVRETYDLHTIRNKMTLIAIHTPRARIIKRNYPGLLMQCRAYRPVKCDVKLACASMLPLDPLGVGTTEGDVAPEDVFNPILYKAISNQTMSQIEQYIFKGTSPGMSARGDSVDARNLGFLDDDFNLYYGLLANTHEWKHGAPQSGLTMTGLVPLVFERLYDYGINGSGSSREAVSDTNAPLVINPDGTSEGMIAPTSFKGKPQRMPFMNTTYSWKNPTDSSIQPVSPGFGDASADAIPNNYQTGVPSPKVYCGLIIVPPSRLHQLFYRLVCEWTIEFSGIRPLSEISAWGGVALVGNAQHVQDYDFGNSKLFNEESSTDLVDSSIDSGIHKVM